jgi:hypothetical protein
MCQGVNATVKIRKLQIVRIEEDDGEAGARLVGTTDCGMQTRLDGGSDIDHRCCR